ncbi:MAG: (Fe-S)-binding protein [Nitrospinae bacterium]|nr:(Fe-S)-binding protein [Nitrospinota bacterium]
MAKTDFEIPKLEHPVKIPAIMEGASSHLSIHPANEQMKTKLGFPEKRVDNWQETAIAKLGELKDKYRSLKIFLDVCVKCGSCADKCHYFLGTGDPNNMPVARQELMRKVYRKNFTIGGKLFGSLARAEDLTEEVLKEWVTYFHQCSQCRRCSVFCPFGIDTAEITMAAREIMDSIGVGHKYSLEIIGKVHDTGNNLGIPKPALTSTLEFLEEDVKETTGADVKFPLDVEGAEVLMVVPSADFFSSPHVDSLVGYAKVFHAAGVSFTFSSHASEFANFGMFVGNYAQMQKIAGRIVQAAHDLKVKRIVVGECGHAWRVAYSFWNTLVGPFDFLDQAHPAPQHICEFTNGLIKRGALKLDKSANDEFTVTFHDSCNVARASRMGDTPGGQFEIPREILKATCNKYVEMPEEVNRERTFCCGGGGGLLTDELMELRVKGAAPKAAALKEMMDEKGVNVMAMICAICKAQFTKVLPYYDIPMETVGGVHQFVSNAIQLGDK